MGVHEEILLCLMMGYCPALTGLCEVLDYALYYLPKNAKTYEL